MSKPEGAHGAPSNDLMAQILAHMTQLTTQIATVITRLDALEAKNAQSPNVQPPSSLADIEANLNSAFDAKFKKMFESLAQLNDPQTPDPDLPSDDQSQTVSEAEMDCESDDSQVSISTVGSRKRGPPKDPDFTVVERRSRKKLRKKVESSRDALVPPPLTPTPTNEPIRTPVVQNIPVPKRTPIQPIRQPQNVQNPSSNSGPKIPPIFLKNPAFWTQVSQQMSIKKISFSQAKIVRDMVRIQTTDPTSFRDTIKLLDVLKLEYHTYFLQEEKPVRAIIRGIHPAIEIQTVKDDLTAQGFEVIKVTRMKSFKTKEPIPLVHVVLTPDQSRIFQITYVCNLHVTIETPHQRGIVSQCHKCQGFYHSQSCCKVSPKCVKCGDSHATSTCPKEIGADPTCANCGANHPASYRGCPKFPKPKKVKKRQTPTPQVPSQPLPQPGDFPPPRKTQNPAPQAQQIPTNKGNYAQALKPNISKQQKTDMFMDLFGSLIGHPNAQEILTKMYLCGGFAPRK